MPASLVKELRGGSGFGAASSGYVVRPLCARPSMDDCLWCSLGEGSVDDCVCGNRVCGICARDDEGDCTCGMHRAISKLY